MKIVLYMISAILILLEIPLLGLVYEQAKEIIDLLSYKNIFWENIFLSSLLTLGIFLIIFVIPLAISAILEKK